jgi:hypothetical protein
MTTLRFALRCTNQNGIAPLPFPVLSRTDGSREFALTRMSEPAELRFQPAQLNAAWKLFADTARPDAEIARTRSLVRLRLSPVLVRRGNPRAL